jgi:hypothetical protein
MYEVYAYYWDIQFAHIAPVHLELIPRDSFSWHDIGMQG